jgi:hypothetical protein
LKKYTSIKNYKNIIYLPTGKSNDMNYNKNSNIIHTIFKEKYDI